MKFWKRPGVKAGLKRATTVFGRAAIRKGLSMYTGGASEQAYSAYSGAATKVAEYLPAAKQYLPQQAQQYLPNAMPGVQARPGARPSGQQQRPWWATGGR